MSWEQMILLPGGVVPRNDRPQRRDSLPIEKQIAEKRSKIARIEDEIEDLRSERYDLEHEIEKLEGTLRRLGQYDGPPFPLQLFNDSLAGSEREFLEDVAAYGCEEERDEKRLRAIIQNHACWWERVSA